MLSVYTNSELGGGDAINYAGKVDGASNIQTKASVEALIKSGGGSVLEEAGYMAITSGVVKAVLLTDPGTKEVSACKVFTSQHKVI